jgi:hypothetical protein
MESHADADARVVRPGVRLEIALPLDRRRDRLGHRAEDLEKNASPSVRTSTPSCRSNAVRRIAW